MRFCVKAPCHYVNYCLRRDNIPHKNEGKSHTKDVAFLFALIAVEAALILLTAPIRVHVRAGADLLSLSVAAKAEIAGAEILRAAVRCGEHGITVNGKRTGISVDRRTESGASAAFAAVRRSVAVKRAAVSAVVGAEDAAAGAVAWAVVSSLSAALPRAVTRRSYLSREDVFYIEAEIVIEISLFAAARAAAAYLSARTKVKEER